MPQFQPDQATFRDAIGYAQFDIGHAREHIQFVQVLAAKTPAVLLPDWDMLQFLAAGKTRSQAIQTHQSVHALLNSTLGLTSVDFSTFNYDDENDFYNFLGYHSQAHAQIRQALGITT